MYPKEHRFISSLVTVGLALATVIVMGRPVAAQEHAQEPGARFYGTVVNMQATMPGTATSPVSIVINRWSTEAEQDRVLTTAMEQGEKALLSLLERLPAIGSVAPTGSVGFNVPYATRSRGADGMERILILTDRPMSFAERWYGGRSTDYPFMLIELTMRPSGQGEGRIIVAARLSVDSFNKTIVVENLDIQPLRLNNVKRER